MRGLGAYVARATSGIAGAPHGIRILMYHSIGDGFAGDSYGLSVKKNQFISQVKLIKANFSTIPITRQGLDSAPRDRLCVGVTFDDGFADNFEPAQILFDAEIPFSIYVVASFIGKPRYLSGSQIRELAANKNCLFGAHGESHEKLGLMPLDQQKKELESSRKMLEDVSGSPVLTMSYPHGCLSQTTMRLAASAGYELAASSRPGVNRASALDWYHLRRTEVQSHDTLSQFEEKIRGYYDYLGYVYTLRYRAGKSGQYVK